MPSLVPGCASGLNGRAYGEVGQQTPTVLGAKIKIENTLENVFEDLKTELKMTITLRIKKSPCKLVVFGCQTLNFPTKNE